MCPVFNTGSLNFVPSESWYSSRIFCTLYLFIQISSIFWMDSLLLVRSMERPTGTRKTSRTWNLDKHPGNFRVGEQNLSRFVFHPSAVYNEYRYTVHTRIDKTKNTSVQATITKSLSRTTGIFVATQFHKLSNLISLEWVCCLLACVRTVLSRTGILSTHGIEATKQSEFQHTHTKEELTTGNKHVQ